MSESPTPRLVRVGHAQHCKVCLLGLPASQIEVDSSTLALSFYCLAGLDLLDALQTKTNESDRQHWTEWIWEQQTHGQYGTAFKPSSYMTPASTSHDAYSEFDLPQMIMTYTALLSLSILRDDFSKLDRPGLLRYLQACQRKDGSFSTDPREGGESDLRMVYCAFAISNMLNDWSGIDVERAVEFIKDCRTYEGGYGQSPSNEAHGGPTFCAIASLRLAPSSSAKLTTEEQRQSIRWLVQNQDHAGGFHGRTEKESDACYCFWCGAALHLLGQQSLVDTTALSSFVNHCQFKFGGVAKAPGETPDPFHTYMSMAAMSLYPPGPESDKSWQLKTLDPLLNATQETADWAVQNIPARK